MARPTGILRVLNIESSPRDGALTLEMLNRFGKKVHYKRIDSLLALHDQLRTRTWDLVISDFNNFGFSVLEALEVVCMHDPDLPFILVTGAMGEESVADMMNAGIEDVVLKSRLVRLIPVLKRITREKQRREMEAKATQLANLAIAAKEQMLAIVSHDIKNPLSAIQLEAEMLQRSAKKYARSVLSDEVLIQSNRILKTTDRLKVLISDLLDKNKSQNSLAQLNFETTRASKLFEEVLEASAPLIEQKEITVERRLPGLETPLTVDRSKFLQVLANLLSNALKFTPDRGTIGLELEETPGEFIFSVSDSGPGLKREELPRVFEKYWTGSSGTGLGLFICKTIVEAHQGRIFVENLPARGARFSFTIPKLSPDVRDATYCFLDENRSSAKKICVVDDDEDLREVICWTLSREGFQLVSFGNPVEAIEALRRDPLAPELILVDYHMEGMRGGEFLRRKASIESLEAVPVVMVSASPEEIARDVDPYHYQEILPKPIDLEGLVSCVKKYAAASMGFGISSYHTS